MSDRNLWKNQLMFEQSGENAPAHLEARKHNLNNNEIRNLQSKIQMASLYSPTRQYKALKSIAFFPLPSLIDNNNKTGIAQDTNYKRNQHQQHIRNQSPLTAGCSWLTVPKATEIGIFHLGCSDSFRFSNIPKLTTESVSLNRSSRSKA
jgi:hypothetical protein